MKKVLIALSSNFSNEIFQENFLKEGFQVATTSSGEEAIEIIKKDPPDMVIADANLSGMTAFQIIDTLRDEDLIKKSPVIVYSRTGSEVHREKAMDYEAKDFIVGLSDSPRDIALKVKSHLGEQKVYIFDLSLNEKMGKEISLDLGYGGGVKCSECGAPLSLHLLRNLNLGKDTFKASLVCPKCSFRHGAKK